MDYSYLVYEGLSVCYVCWYIYGVYICILEYVCIVQINGRGEVIFWEMNYYGGILFVIIFDLIVEYGI